MRLKTGKVLIATDDTDEGLKIIAAWQEIVDQDAIEIKRVRNGVELIDYLFRRGVYSHPEKSPTPNLIFLDVELPIKDGLKSLAEIKSKPQLRMIPVIVLLSTDKSCAVEESYDLGANSCMMKPLRKDDLVVKFRFARKYWFDVVTMPQPLPAKPLISVTSIRSTPKKRLPFSKHS